MGGGAGPQGAQFYQVDLSREFRPYRVAVQFLNCREAPIKPLIDQLSFIKSKTHWGAAFRFGQLKIPAADFTVIAKAWI